MSDSIINRVEQEFNVIKNNMTTEQWNDGVFIRDLAMEHENTNICLAYRLMQRAHNIKPEGQVIKNRLKHYTKQVNEQVPEFFGGITSSQITLSVESPPQKNFRSKLGNYEHVLQNHFVMFVLIPVLIFAFYQGGIASERFESRAKILVQQPDSMSSVSPELAMLGSLGVQSGDNDAKLLEAFIYSVDMLKHLDSELGLKEHYSSHQADIFSRLDYDASTEDFFEFYTDHVNIETDELSGVIELKIQGFEPEYAKKISQEIIKRSEKFINEISYHLANEQVKFMSNEHAIWQKNLKLAQNKMLGYQQEYKLLDPIAEGTALQSISYNLEGQIASLKAQLHASKTLMADSAPEVQTLQNQLSALEQQLIQEKSRLSLNQANEKPVSEIIAQFAALKIDYEMATQAYTASLASLEKAKVDAYRQIKYLITVESPTLAEDNEYPRVIYNVTLLLIILSLMFGIVKMVIATIKELN
ncbi:lipopolysaccharide biosynthesis protein [Thalassotalea eurytherma]|uniref:Lipopolysaccharide biosynthesis protein n=1 Tax=Thalassotalea eurytherma TaxID=1144278 RepID=A0ABQ6H139_9GAMM|nr:lipopolysaccharide biosynthesis protein [Thalassotalea eurytherma]GLX81307.1 hypothetical protein theurythT_07590 [Thalassotalea eurytherma]